MSELPAPPQDPIPDPTGARNLDGEANKRLPFNTRTPKPSRDTPRTEQTPTPVLTGDAAMLKSTFGFVLIPSVQYGISTFLPSSHMLYTVLNDMDNMMVINRYWSRKQSTWTPVLSRIYVGVLFYIQTFRCMIYANIASPTIRNFMRDFEQDFRYEQLPIPGPLVPFFRALTVSRPSLEGYGFVTPSLPPLPGATNATAHALHESIRHALPAIASLRRSHIRMTRIAANVVYTWDSNFANDLQAVAAVPIVHNAANQATATARTTPGLAFDIAYSTAERNTYQRSSYHIDVPGLPHDAGALTWPSFLGFTTGTTWFADLVTLMRDYTSYFNDSTTLSNCSVENGRIPLAYVTSQNVLPNQVDHLDTAIHATYTDVVISTAEPLFTEEDAQYAILTQINYVPPENLTALADVHLPATNRNGPWWNVAPEKFTSQPFDPALSVGYVLADTMFSPRGRGTFR